MHALTAPPDISSADRLSVTIFFAVLAHLILILGVTFVREDRFERRVETLDVVLVPQRSETVPDRPDYLAQANQDGGGDHVEKIRPSTPNPTPLPASEPAITAARLAMPASEPRLVLPMIPARFAPPPTAAPEEAPAPAVSRKDATTAFEVVAAPVQTAPAQAALVGAIPIETAPLEAALVEATPAEAIPTEAITAEAVPAETASVDEVSAEAAPAGSAQPPAQPRRTRESDESRAIVRSARSEPERTAAAPSEPDSTPAPVTRATPARGFDTATSVSRSLAIAALSAEIDRKLRAYAERPRRKWISARTREHKLAAYMDAWRRKVERIGNLNYPDEAARRGLSGNLLLEVAIKSDGTVEEIVLRRSSGERVLDEAAIRIVKLAAPFSKFSESIGEEVDILHIERTWIFLSDNRFTRP